MSDGVVFLTGATGALGSWIARRALADGRKVCALARAAAGQSAQQRIEQSLTAVGDQPISARVQVIEGDILDSEVDPGPVDLIIHCAACTAFHDRSAEASRQTNVQGLQSILNLARRQRIPLVHVSTAYVCGNRAGQVLESELNVGQHFNNIYERTKCEGESLVREWSRLTGLPAIILRPSIVLGDWAHGRAARFNTLYHLMRALDAVGPSRNSRRLRLVGHANVTKNIIPVDYFAEVAWRIIRRGGPGTYHIAHPDPITLGELRGIFNDLFNIDVQLVSEQEFSRERGTRIERMCHQVMAPYRSYMLNQEPRFDRRATVAALGEGISEAPKLDAGYFRRLLDYGRRVNWGQEVVADPLIDPAVDPVREYFEVFLAERTNQDLLPDLKRLSARFSISMKDLPGSHWCLDVQDGVLRSVSRDGTLSDCAFAVDSATFLEIAAGRLPPQRAFFMGRIQISGNIELGLKVATVLAKFFLEHPFVAESV
ncbi:MAG: 3 beta-hydroxysteroid dehydrogenase/Delta 5--_4-isomerase [Phycisphaerales bacterium]|nr:3 beta-hydroxysteroid dehydrogenase/Delta 5-->4-isomerase [Phycisphaerales bacterium]